MKQLKQKAILPVLVQSKASSKITENTQLLDLALSQYVIEP